MLFLNHPCMNHDEFVAWKNHLDTISAENGKKNEHTFVQEDKVEWPALVLTGVQEVPGNRDERWMTHTALTKSRILKILGLSTEDIKFQFEAGALTETTPESFEAREI